MCFEYNHANKRLRFICTDDLTNLDHYENLPMQYTEIFKVVKNEIFSGFFFAQNIDFGYTLEPPLTSTHNLCFGAKIRKIGIPLHTPVFLYKSGVQGGIHFTNMFS